METRKRRKSKLILGGIWRIGILMATILLTCTGASPKSVVPNGYGTRPEPVGGYRKISYPFVSTYLLRPPFPVATSVYIISVDFADMYLNSTQQEKGNDRQHPGFFYLATSWVKPTGPGCKANSVDDTSWKAEIEEVAASTRIVMDVKCLSPHLLNKTPFTVLVATPALDLVVGEGLPPWEVIAAISNEPGKEGPLRFRSDRNGMDEKVKSKVDSLLTQAERQGWKGEYSDLHLMSPYVERPLVLDPP